MGSPKRRGRSRGPLWRRWLYRFLYAVLVVASAYLVLSQFQSRLAPSASEHLSGTRRLGSGGEGVWESAEARGPIVLAGVENLSQPMRRWIEKPDSLCFGIGNISILSITPGLPQAFLEQLRKNRLWYAYRHGYRYCEVSTVLDLFSPVPWTKMSAVMLLLSFADVVVHMHPDAVIRNDSVTVESIINMPEYNVSTKDVIFSTSFSSSRVVEASMKDGIDTGVFIVRSSSWSKTFLEVLCKFFRPSLFHSVSEEDALELYRSKHFQDFCDHVAIVPFWYLNSPCGDRYKSYQHGDFVARYLGDDGAEKYGRLASMLRMEAGVASGE